MKPFSLPSAATKIACRADASWSVRSRYVRFHSVTDAAGSGNLIGATVSQAIHSGPHSLLFAYRKLAQLRINKRHRFSTITSEADASISESVTTSNPSNSRLQFGYSSPSQGSMNEKVS